MKKNLRIVSAAAAALLAVAPVAAGVVPAANVASTQTVKAAASVTDLTMSNNIRPDQTNSEIKTAAINTVKGYSITSGFTELSGAAYNRNVEHVSMMGGNYSAATPANNKVTVTANGVWLSFKLSGAALTDSDQFGLNFNGTHYSTADNGDTAIHRAGNGIYQIKAPTTWTVSYTVSGNPDTYQVMYTNGEASLYTKAEGTNVFTITDKSLSKNTPVKVSANPVTGTTGTKYYKITAGTNSGKYVEASYLSPNAYENSEAYFATANGNELANDATVYANTKNSKAKTIGELKQAIMNTVNFVNGKTNKPYSAAGWNMYVFNNYENDDNYLNHSNATSDADLISQLENAGISVTNTGDNAKFNAGTTTYTITVRSNNGKRVNIVFQNTDAINQTAPAFRVRSDVRRSAGADNSVDQLAQRGDWSGYYNENDTVPTISLVQRDSGTFNPRDYIEAVNNVKSHGLINFDVKSNNVDWTKAGLYSVTVEAKNAAGKTTTLTIPVVVSDANGKMMTAIKDANVYKEENGKMVQANLVNFNVLRTGSAIRVFDTKTVDGVQYYRVVSATTNLWVRADALKNGVTTPATAETPVTKTVNHIAAIYNKEGKQTNDKKLRAYNPVTVLPTTVTINGSKMYQIAENGKGVDKYVKASNIDGVSKTLTKNAYVYTAYGKKVYKKNGKAVKMPKKGHRSVLRKETAGKSVTVYGGALFNKQFYRIGHNQYIKVANFR